MNPRTLLTLLIAGLLFSNCGRSPAPESPRCAPPPDTFRDSDLVGTWIGQRASTPRVTDTLIISEDGLYRQTVEGPESGFEFEGEWLAWRLEEGEAGMLYLHLTGMRLCAFVPDLVDCAQAGGGAGYWFDPCTGEWVPMPGEGILAVVQVPDAVRQPPRGLLLVPFNKHVESGWVYELQEP